MEAIENSGDININDVTIFQNLLARRDAMTDDLVDRSADGFGEALVIQWSWDRIMVKNVFVTETIQFLGANTWFDVGLNILEHARCKAAGLSHLFDFVRAFDFDRHSLLHSYSAAHVALTGGDLE